jgi:hypothetical protein
MSAIQAVRHLSVVLAVVSLAGACAAATSPAPSTDAGMTPTVAPSSGATPTPSPSLSPRPTPTPEVGVAWQRVDDPDLVSRPRNGSMYGVISGGPGAIAWGFVYATGPRIWTTSDGRDWTPATVEAIDDANPEYPGEVLDIAAGGPGYVAVGTYGRAGGDGATAVVWTSADGTTWQRVPFGPAFERSQIGQVVAWKGGLLAFGCENASPIDCGPTRVWTSADGSTWTRSAPTLPGGLAGVGIVAPADDRLWGTGSPDTGGDLPENRPQPSRVTSLDGLTWTTERLPVLGIERLHPLRGGLYLTVVAIPTGDPDFIQPPAWVSRNPGVYRSTDQATWEPLAVGTELGQEIVAVGDTLIMVGGFRAAQPTAWRSTDAGLTWDGAPVEGVLPKTVTSAMMRSVAALRDGTLVAVGAEMAGPAPSTAAWVSPPRPVD